MPLWKLEIFARITNFLCCNLEKQLIHRLRLLIFQMADHFLN